MVVIKNALSPKPAVFVRRPIFANVRTLHDWKIIMNEEEKIRGRNFTPGTTTAWVKILGSCYESLPKAVHTGGTVLNNVVKGSHGNFGFTENHRSKIKHGAKWAHAEIYQPTTSTPQG